MMQRGEGAVRIHPVSVIGEGPQGEVFIGMDEVLRRRVVVKKIAAKSLSRDSRANLIAEARALCKLNHPNILHIYNYAEEDGHDVFIFECAAGKTLAEALEQKIDFAEKVRIAVAIASGLVIAHRNGIVHGALSTRTVLIAKNGEIKVTDFPSMSTSFDRLRFTRAQGSHPSDMLAFGLLLRALFGENDRDVRALVTSLLADAPSERPTAAEALAVLQRLASRRARRIRIGAVVLVILSFVAGAVKYTVDLQRERREAIAAREEAEEGRKRANELVTYMIKDVRSKLAFAGRLDIMDATSEKVLSHFGNPDPSLIPAHEAGMHLEALSQVANAKVQRGNYADARAILERAITLAEAALVRFPDDPQLRHAAGIAYGTMSWALDREGDLNGAIRYGRFFANTVEHLVRRHPDNSDYIRSLASAHSNLGTFYDKREEIAASLIEVERAVTLKRQAVALEDDAENRFELAIPVRKQGQALFKLGRFDEAVKTLETERANIDALLARNSTQWKLRELVTVFDEDLTTVKLAMGDLEAAARHCQTQLAVTRQLTSFDAANIEWQRRLVIAHRLAGTIARMKGDVVTAMSQHGTSVELLSGVFAKGHRTRYLSREMSINRTELARSLVAARRTDAAAIEINLAVEALRLADTDRTEQRLLGDALLVQGEVRAAQGDAAGAGASWQEALRVLVPLDELSPDPRIADAHARVLLRLGRIEEAQPLIEQLAATGYRNREFEALHRSKGMFLSSR